MHRGLWNMKKKVVGLGEVLWDIFPERTCLGGAPANFAYITTLMGDQGVVASRVGEDARGLEALRRMEELGLDIDHVQTDRDHATGTVKVEVDGKGTARYEIAKPVAWDFLEWTADWQELAKTADAVCFGSLAQRSENSRATIQRFVKAGSSRTLKVFDVNLRQAYYSQEVLAESMRLADIVKLNDEELPKIMSLCGLPNQSSNNSKDRPSSHPSEHPSNHELSSAQQLIAAFGLKLVCITRGGRGSLLVRDGESSEHPGFRVRVADTVGSGDAFTAGLVHEYLHGASLALMNEVANLVGAWVASEVGAMPTPKRGALENSLAEIR
jgi:fructokinase